MKRWEKGLLFSSSFGVWLTGVLYLYLHFFVIPPDPFAVVNHPLQPWMQKLHILIAPLAIFSLGVILKEHILNHTREKPKSCGLLGYILIGLGSLMILSGYLYQVATSLNLRGFLFTTHWVVSLVWSVSLLLHIFRQKA